MMNIPFSPPDITEEEINEVVDTLRSGWITTGPKTKKFEEEIADSVIPKGRYVSIQQLLLWNCACVSWA